MELKFTLKKRKGFEAVKALHLAVRELVERTDENHLPVEGDAYALREHLARIHATIGRINRALNTVGENAYYYYDELEAVNNPQNKQ